MYPAIPVAVAFSDGNLMVYSDTHVDVFDCGTGEWLQTVNLKKCRPLCRTGALNVAFVADLPHIVYFSFVSRGEQKCFYSMVRLPAAEYSWRLVVRCFGNLSKVLTERVCFDGL
jgi:hypothetical protein